MPPERVCIAARHRFQFPGDSSRTRTKTRSAPANASTGGHAARSGTEANGATCLSLALSWPWFDRVLECPIPEVEHLLRRSGRAPVRCMSHLSLDGRSGESERRASDLVGAVQPDVHQRVLIESATTGDAPASITQLAAAWRAALSCQHRASVLFAHRTSHRSRSWTVANPALPKRAAAAR